MAQSDETVEMRERVRDFVYDCTKDEFSTGWTLSAHQTDDLIALITSRTTTPVDAGLVERIDVDTLRYVLNFADTNTRVSTVMKTFTLPDRLTTHEKLERLYAALEAIVSSPVKDERHA